jgi:hypothetical protein
MGDKIMTTKPNTVRALTESFETEAITRLKAGEPLIGRQGVLTPLIK